MKIIFVSITISLFFFSGCTPATYNDDPIWNQVAGYLTDSTRTDQELIDRMSREALEGILFPNKRDTAKEIRELFAYYKDDHNYEIKKEHDSVYICFDPDVEVAAGPVFEIKRNDTAWKVISVAFGK